LGYYEPRCVFCRLSKRKYYEDLFEKGWGYTRIYNEMIRQGDNLVTLKAVTTHFRKHYIPMQLRLEEIKKEQDFKIDKALREDIELIKEIRINLELGRNFVQRLMMTEQEGEISERKVKILTPVLAEIRRTLKLLDELLTKHKPPTRTREELIDELLFILKDADICEKCNNALSVRLEKIKYE